MSGYDPQRSVIAPDKLAEFIQAPITGDLTEVPGVGPATQKAMIAAGVTTTYALIGKYLMLKDAGVESVEHCDRFFYWLDDIGASKGHRSSIVQAIAQKQDITFPGIYDGSLY
jgi:hypothetical protein